MPTAYSDLNHVLRQLVYSAQEILRGNFVGVYLQGSFAVGDFDLHSDVDFVIVIAEELSEEQIDALQAMHARLYGSEHSGHSTWKDPIFQKKSCGTIPRKVGNSGISITAAPQ